MRFLYTIASFLLCFSLMLPKASAQTADPFECSPGIYQVVSGQLNILDPNTGNYLPIGSYAGFDYNNMAYNPDDGFIYALSRGNGTDALGVSINNQSLIKIDNDGEVFFVMDTGEGGGSYAGDIVNGELWVRRSSTRYEAINLTTFAITQHNLSAGAPPADWVLVGDYLYGVHNDNSGQAILYLINTTNDQVSSYPISGMSGLSGNRAFGAAYRVNSNQLYVSWNEGGLYILGDYHSSTPTGTYVVPSAVTNSNDGGSCPTAPFPKALLGLALDATEPIDNGNGTYTVTYTCTIQNLGNVSYYDLTLTNNLTTAFGTYTSGTPSSAGTYTISGPPTVTSNTSNPFTTNASFTGDPNGSGSADDNVLIITGTEELDGYPTPESMVVQYTITFNPVQFRTSFLNQAVVSGDIVGDGVSDSHFIDFSTEGNNADPDADNNPVDNSEVTFFSTNEDCSNGLDDDGDGFIDCDDGDCAQFSGCAGVGGGGGGGLESNDNLASKIAKRSYERATSSINLEDKKQLAKIIRPEDYGTFETVSFRDEFDISEFMPIDIFPNTETFVSTPDDLVEITNAIQVASVDLFDGDQRLAVALGIKSEGVYEHSKYVCDRVKGAEIRNIFTHKIDGEHDYTVTYFQNRYGDIEYNTNISLYVADDQTFVLDSYWDLDAYDDSKTYYNFQIWANSMDRLEAITNEILALLEAKLPISTYNFSDIPKVYAKSLYYENESVVLNVVNQAGADTVQLIGNGLQVETGDRRDFVYTLPLNGELEQQIQVPTGGLYSFGADLVHDENEVADVLFTADGFWGLAFQKEATSIDDWTIEKSTHETGSNSSTETSWVERNFHLKATTENYVTVYRSMNPAFRGEDFSDYNTLSFDVEGSGELEIVIIKSNIERMEDQMRINYLLDGACKKVYLHREAFENNQPWDDVKMIYFTQRSEDGKTNTKIDLKISDIAFINANETVKNCADYNQLTIEAYPNPTTGPFHFQLPRPDIDYEFVLTNTLGQTVLSRRGTLLVDGQLTIDEVLEPGLYHYQFRLESGLYAGKVLVGQKK